MCAVLCYAARVSAVRQGTPAFNAPTMSRKGLLRFVRGVLKIRKKYRNLLAPPMFDSPRAIRYGWRGTDRGLVSVCAVQSCSMTGLLTISSTDDEHSVQT